jgi:transposase
MSLIIRKMFDVPEQTARVARAVFPKGNVYMTMRDELGVLYTDGEWAPLFSHRGQPAEAPGLVAMVTVMQFAEGMTDRQAADAVRSRIDWKYALGLELTDPGFHYSVLSEFRDRVIAGGLEAELLNTMLTRLQEKGLLRAGGQQRSDSSHVLAAVRQVNRLGCVFETIRKVLDDVAVVAPDWLLAQVGPDWFDRYGPRFDSYRMPEKKAEREALQTQIGVDGFHLLSAIYDPAAPSYVREIPSVEIMRRVWIQQYYVDHGQVTWRSQQDLPPNQILIQSPFDPEARNRTKRGLNWTGYSVHLTETCDLDRPNLITHVETTPATTFDGKMTPHIHRALAGKGLLPRVHIVDTGYIEAQHLVSSHQDYHIDLLGPAPPDSSWQAKAGQGFDISCFVLDWQAQQVTCPCGRISQSWRRRTTPSGHKVIEVHFARADCRVCPSRSQCTRGETNPRLLKFRLQPEHEALQAARRRQVSAEFKARYKTRAGIEGTISQGTRSFDLRRSRYIGLAKTHLQHLATATAMNLTRVVTWLREPHKARTRQSRFAALAPAT